jgi:transposase
MLGPAKPREFGPPVAVSLDALVPRDHVSRYLDARLDLGFVRDWIKGSYPDRGRPSIALVVFCKLQLATFFEGIRSERRLVETASLDLAHRRYLGYTLDEALPDHFSLTRIRQRLGIDLFERFFDKAVDLCQEAGLVWGRELFVNASKVKPTPISMPSFLGSITKPRRTWPNSLPMMLPESLPRLSQGGLLTISRMG